MVLIAFSNLAFASSGLAAPIGGDAASASRKDLDARYENKILIPSNARTMKKMFFGFIALPHPKIIEIGKLHARPKRASEVFKRLIPSQRIYLVEYPN
jgi:hypothetical protein